KGSRELRFSKEKWEVYETNKFGIRVGTFRRQMLNDLTARVLKQGMAKESVFSLLGPPDRESRDTNYIWQQYFIGEASGSLLSILPTDYYLDLCFDRNGNLKTHRIETAK